MVTEWDDERRALERVAASAILIEFRDRMGCCLSRVRATAVPRPGEQVSFAGRRPHFVRDVSWAFGGDDSIGGFAYVEVYPV